MCLCTTPYAVCKPTARAKILGRLLRFIMIILFGLMICGFIGGYFQLSILCIFLIVTGFCGVRSNNAYNIEQVLCVTFFSGYIWIYTLVDLIQTIIASSFDISVFRLIALFGGVIFYAAACVIAKLLYDELRTHYEQTADPMQGPSFLNALRGRSSNPAQPVPDQPSAEEVPLNVRNGRGVPLGGGNGNIPPSNRGDRGRPLGQAKNEKFKPYHGVAHKLEDK